MKQTEGWQVYLLREQVEEPRSLEEKLWLEEQGQFGAELVAVA